MISLPLKRTGEAFEWDAAGFQCVSRRSSVSAHCTVIAYSFAIEGQYGGMSLRLGTARSGQHCAL